MTPQEILRRRESGELPDAEFVQLLLETVTAENVGDVLGRDGVLVLLRARVDHAPRTDDEWARGVDIRDCCGRLSREDRAMIGRLQVESRKRFRRGVEAVRAHLGG